MTFTLRSGLLILWGCWLVAALMGCSGEEAPPPLGQVVIQGVADDGADNSPLAHAICRVVNLRGQELVRSIADPDGRYRLPVNLGVRGVLACGLSDFPDLTLSTFITTQGRHDGERLTENVSPQTTAVALIVRSRHAANPQATKNRLLADYREGQPEIATLIQGTTILFNFLKNAGINTNLALAQTDLFADGELDQAHLRDVAMDMRFLSELEDIEAQYETTVSRAYATLASVGMPCDACNAPEVEGGADDSFDGGVDGHADDGGPTSPIAFAVCRYVTLADTENGAVDDAVIATVIADANGRFFPIRSGATGLCGM